jgi:hypothetical protein
VDHGLSTSYGRVGEKVMNNYKLVCNGRLLDGANEQKALLTFSKIARISEEQAKKICSSGRRIKLSSTDDRDKLDKVCQLLRNAGVDVEVVPDTPQEEHPETESTSQPPASPEIQPETESEDQPPPEEEAPKTRGSRSRILIAAVALLVIITGSIGGYGWYWLYMTESPQLLKAEQALADKGLVAVAYVDVDKAVVLSDHVFGPPDPHSLPVSEPSQKLLEMLFNGPADFKHNLKQALFSIHAQPEQQAVASTVLLSGNFDATAITSELSSEYDVTPLDGNRWELVKKAATKAVNTGATSSPCKKETPTPAAMAHKALPLQLRISPNWLILSDNPSHADKLWQRLKSGANATQDMKRWRNYRQGQLAALMVFVPDKAARGISGMPGMMARGAVQQIPDVTGMAAAAKVSIPSAGLGLNFSMFSNNAQWNSDTAAKIRKRLDDMQVDSKSVSPTFSKLFSRVSLEDSKEMLAVNVALDTDVLNDFDDIVQEGMSSLFAPTVSAGGHKGPAKEQLNQHPADYGLYAGLTRLPDLKQDQFQSSKPLFDDGAYAVDLKSVSYEKGGYFQLGTEAKVALLPGRKFMSDYAEKLSFIVSSVKSRDGEELMRDEHCLPRGEVFGALNHQPETNFSTMNNQAVIMKNVRLTPGVRLEDIDTISGKVSFSAPTAVSRFPVTLKAGETIEHGGMRFYLSSIKDSSVSYQVSGKQEKLLEVRALNKQGKPLSGSWSMSPTNGEGRVTKAFQGKIAGLEIYIADKSFQQEKSFVLRDILAVPEKKVDKIPPSFSSRRIDPGEWEKYASHNMKQLKVDPKDLQVWDKNKTPIAEADWPTVKMYVTHTPKKWGNEPQIHLFYPMLKGLPGVLSGMSSVVSEPAPKDGPKEQAHHIFYPYYSNSGKLVIKHKLDGLPVAYQAFTLNSGLGDNEKLTRLKGKLIFRLPTETKSTKLPLKELWAGKEVDGISITLKGISRGMFPGYELKIAGDIDKLVNVQGIGDNGKRVMGDPVNYQSDGYWTMTLPFNHGIESVELITAKKQNVIKFPFDLKPNYPG